MAEQEGIDSDPMNADWPKSRHWDLPTDPDNFWRLLAFMGMTAEEFLILPAAIPMPQQVQEALRARGYDTTKRSPRRRE